MGNNIVCRDCKHCALGYVDTSQYSAKCMNNSKRGRTITWAMNVVFPVRVSGEERVKKELNRQRIAPCWCPIRKGYDL